MVCWQRMGNWLYWTYSIQRDKWALHYCGFGVSVLGQKLCFYHHLILCSIPAVSFWFSLDVSRCDIFNLKDEFLFYCRLRETGVIVVVYCIITSECLKYVIAEGMLVWKQHNFKCEISRNEPVSSHDSFHSFLSFAVYSLYSIYLHSVRVSLGLCPRFHLQKDATTQQNHFWKDCVMLYKGLNLE